MESSTESGFSCGVPASSGPRVVISAVLSPNLASEGAVRTRKISQMTMPEETSFSPSYWVCEFLWAHKGRWRFLEHLEGSIVLHFWNPSKRQQWRCWALLWALFSLPSLYEHTVNELSPLQMQVCSRRERETAAESKCCMHAESSCN